MFELVLRLCEENAGDVVALETGTAVAHARASAVFPFVGHDCRFVGWKRRVKKLCSCEKEVVKSTRLVMLKVVKEWVRNRKRLSEEEAKNVVKEAKEAKTQGRKLIFKAGLRY